ncbi:hypothetical protein C8J57DRAFT_1319718 [Mycena rebaudengoi]|nr:hypothetical protein C8J57DRAFT_1319718 [Mycena rebaudengoi]
MSTLFLLFPPLPALVPWDQDFAPRSTYCTHLATHHCHSSAPVSWIPLALANPRPGSGTGQGLASSFSLLLLALQASKIKSLLASACPPPTSQRSQATKLAKYLYGLKESFSSNHASTFSSHQIFITLTVG